MPDQLDAFKQRTVHADPHPADPWRHDHSVNEQELARVEAHRAEKQRVQLACQKKGLWSWSSGAVCFAWRDRGECFQGGTSVERPSS